MKDSPILMGVVIDCEFVCVTEEPGMIFFNFDPKATHYFSTPYNLCALGALTNRSAMSTASTP